MTEQDQERERRRERELDQQRLRYEEDRIGAGTDESGQWVPAACVVCQDDTRLRCGGCRMAVCHLHDRCPNGCDDAPVAVEDLTLARNALGTPRESR